ncbi:MAG: AGE family epimerase/isomerase [Rhodobacteraceae bacterium]|nr:AGE family epimerase/isomerase [Paracoccaceae bacterium]
MSTTERNYRDPNFLTGHIREIIQFYHPVCMDHEFGGFINQLRDDGTVFDRLTKHLVGTCRFVFCFSVASMMLNSDEYRLCAAHGVKFLLNRHRQRDGGFAWLMRGHDVVDSTNHCYGHAFVLLAAATATKAGVDASDELFEAVWDVLETKFWDPSSQLYVDEIKGGDWTSIDGYRGQNANMHLCEALLASYEATNSHKFLDRAEILARRICVDIAASANGLVWEHYHADWSHNWSYNRDNPRDLFRTYGFLPGHFTEWSKLLVILDRYRPNEWSATRAEQLFGAAMNTAWVPSTGAINYTFGPDGRILDTDQYYWVFAETLAAAALLAIKTQNDDYWLWYDRAWSYADRHFVDHKHGGWYRVLDRNGKRYSDRKSPPAKTDYHPVSACYEVLQALLADGSECQLPSAGRADASAV